MDILVSLSLLGYCLVMRRFFRWPIEATPFFIVSATIVLFYIFAYCNVLQPASLLFILLGGLCLITAPIYLHGQYRNIFSKYFTPGFTTFILYLCMFGIMAHSLIATDWDEFIIWLPHAKFLYLNHGFWNASNDSIPAYNNSPPGSALFYYLFLRLSSINEGHLYYAQLILMLSPLAILLRKYPWSNWSETFIIFSFILILFIFGFHVQMGPTGTLLMDEITALFFGSILASYYIFEKKYARWLYLLFPIMAFLLLRPMLMPFLAIIAVIILCDQLYLFVHRKNNLSSMVLFFITMIISALPLTAWQHYAKKYLISTAPWSLKQIIFAIKNKSLTLDPQQLHHMLPRYLHALIPPFLFTIVMLIVIVWIYRRITDRMSKQRLLMMHFGLGSGFIVYIMLLLAIYFFVMPTEMVLQMNSFKRFINIYQIGWLVVLLSNIFYMDAPNIITNTVTKIPKIIKIILVFILILLFPIYTSIHNHKQSIDFKNKMGEIYMRHAIQQQLTNPMLHLIKKNSNIGFAWNGWGLMTYIISYELMPNKILILKNTTQLENLNYLIIGGQIKNELKQNYTPFTTFTFCTDANFNEPNSIGCSFHKIPFFLFKVVLKDGKLNLVNVPRGSIPTREKNQGD